MFDKILAGIKVAREGARVFDVAQKKLAAIQEADKDLDGHKDVEQLKTIIMTQIPNTLKVLKGQVEIAVNLIKGLVLAARES